MDKDRALIEWIMDAYGFLARDSLERGTESRITANQFAELIRDTYSLKEPHNLAAYVFLKRRGGFLELQVKSLIVVYKENEYGYADEIC